MWESLIGKIAVGWGSKVAYNSENRLLADAWMPTICYSENLIWSFKRNNVTGHFVKNVQTEAKGANWVVSKKSSWHWFQLDSKDVKPNIEIFLNLNSAFLNPKYRHALKNKLNKKNLKWGSATFTLVVVPLPVLEQFNNCELVARVNLVDGS